MSIENARAHLRLWQKDKDIIELETSLATVALAAAAIGAEEAHIAKSLSFMKGDKAILVLTSGDMKIDGAKFKQEFGVNASLLGAEDVLRLIGHPVGGVCPFGIIDGVDVFLDISLQRSTTVYPACGNSHSVIGLSCDELVEIAAAKKWVDVSKDK